MQPVAAESEAAEIHSTVDDTREDTPVKTELEEEKETTDKDMADLGVQPTMVVDLASLEPA